MFSSDFLHGFEQLEQSARYGNTYGREYVHVNGTECSSPRIDTVFPRSSDFRLLIAVSKQPHARSQKSISSARLTNESTNSESRLRPDFSPSVVRKSVHAKAISGDMLHDDRDGVHIFVESNVELVVANLFDHSIGQTLVSL